MGFILLALIVVWAIIGSLGIYFIQLEEKEYNESHRR
jgi:hypothetical protein